MSTRSARYSSVGLRAPKGRFGSGTDKDAAAFLEAAQIIDSTQERAIYNLVRNLKQAGLWTKMKAIYPFIGGTAASHKWNLKDPRDLDAAFRLVFYGGVTHASTGVKGNGTNAYADTFIRTNPDLTQNSTHLSFYSRTQVAENSQEFMAYTSGNNYTGILLRSTTNNSGSFLYSAEAGVSVIATGTTLTSMGLFVGSRTNSSSHKMYINGAQVGTTSTSTNTLYLGNTAKISLFARNVGDSYRELWGTRECAFASAGDGLTDAEVATLTRIVQRYQIALNRAVDFDAENFISAAAITNQVQKDAILQLVLRLKSTGIWDKMRAIYPFVGGTAAAHKFNLKNPQDTNAAYRLAFYGGWTHSANGAVGNGTNAYADTFFVASTAPLALYDGHLSYYNRTNLMPSTIEVFMGSASNSPTWDGKQAWMISYDGTLNPKEVIGSQHAWWTSTAATDAAKAQVTTRTGFWTQSRKSITATTLKLFRNGSAVANATTSAAGQALNIYSVYLSATNNRTVGAPYANSYIVAECAFASIGEGLDDLQVSDLYNIVQQYQTTLGRQV